MKDICTAMTKKQKPCPNKVDAWREGTLCHVHDPKGTFRKQVKDGTARRLRQAGPKEHGPRLCGHTWYMRELGIQCTKCLILWNRSMDEASI